MFICSTVSRIISLVCFMASLKRDSHVRRLIFYFKKFLFFSAPSLYVLLSLRARCIFLDMWDVCASMSICICMCICAHVYVRTRVYGLFPSFVLQRSSEIIRTFAMFLWPTFSFLFVGQSAPTLVSWAPYNYTSRETKENENETKARDFFHE